MSSPSPSLTPQQQAAIHTRDVSVALSAGAGCGKTFVLTQRFLRHLQPECGPDALSGLVAITFTDRAAREMRDRIRLECHEQLERCQGDEVAHWLEILRGLDSARISTIHSFCAALLRSSAVDARLDPHFGLLDNAEGDVFLRRAVNDSLHDLLSEHDADSMDLVLHYGLDRTRELLRHLVLGRFHADLSRFENATADRLASEWLDCWRNEFLPRRFRDLVESNAAQRCLALLREHRPSHPEMQSRCSLLLDELPRLSEANDPQSLLERVRQNAQVQGGGGKTAWDGEDVYEEIKNALQALRKAIDQLRDDLQVDDSDVQKAAEFSLKAARVLRRLLKHYEARKQDAGVLDFDDLLLLTRNLLRDETTVRERSARGIDFLLVDEFQDTDPVQAEIVRLLCGDELATGKLFVVGDAKQSIYRFRRADPNVFVELRGELPERGRLPLSTNFRSQPEILKFVNWVFGPVMARDYEPLIPHEGQQHSPTPAVEFLFAAPSPDEQRDHEKETAEDRREREADWLARRIAALLHDPTPRIREIDRDTGSVQLRPPRPGDVAVLFRTLSNVAIYEEALRRYGLSYYLVGSRAFYAQQEVYDLVNLCQFLDDCDDEVALAGVLRSPFFGLNDDTLFALADLAGRLGRGVRHARPLAAALQLRPPENLDEVQRIQIEYAAEVLEELRSRKDRIPLSELLRLAVDRTGYDASLLNEHLGRRKLANLNKLLDMARQADRGGRMTLKDFVVRLRESIREETQEELAATHPESSDVVRLMTIHQAKGLQFPAVVVADMDWMRRGGSMPATIHPKFGPLFSLPALHGEKPKHLGRVMHKYAERKEDEAETIRLLYVAATRAADYLFLSAGLDAERRPTSPWLKLLADRFDLQTGQARESLNGRPPDIRVHDRPPEPQVVPESARSSSLPLSQFRETVKRTAPAPLPSTARRLAPDVTRRRRFTVSEIERADAASSEPRGPSPLNRQPEPNAPPISAHHSAPLDPTALGTLLHRVLEQVDVRAEQPPALFLERVAAAMDDAPEQAVLGEAQARLQAFFDSPLRRELADADQCFREIEFLLRWPVGGDNDDVAIISGTIDCLYRTLTPRPSPSRRGAGGEGQWRLLDYKTGIAPAHSETVRKQYELQLVLYALAAREFLGRLPEAVEVVLLSENVRRLPIDVTDPTLEDVSRRVDAAIGTIRDSG